MYKISTNIYRTELLTLGIKLDTRVGYTLALCSSELHILHLVGLRPEGCVITPLKTASLAIRAFLTRSCPSSAIKTPQLAIYERGVFRLRF